MTQHPGDHGSLRNWPKPEPQPRPSLESGIDQIFRHAGRSQQDDRKDATVERPEALSDIHSMAEIPGRIEALERAGVTQLTGADLKTMKPEQIVEAHRQGRLLRHMTTPSGGGYRTSSAG